MRANVKLSISLVFSGHVYILSSLFSDFCAALRTKHQIACSDYAAQFSIFFTDSRQYKDDSVNFSTQNEIGTQKSCQKHEKSGLNKSEILRRKTRPRIDYSFR